MSSAHPFKVEIQPCRTLADYFFVRQLRNKNYHFMTNNANRISVWQQLRFIRNKPDSLKLYVASINNQRVGYLLLDYAHTGTAFITEAVEERWRRHGVGVAMIAFAKTQAKHLTAHIKASNMASIQLHQHCGFTQIPSETTGIVTYVFSSLAN